MIVADESIYIGCENKLYIHSVETNELKRKLKCKSEIRCLLLAEKSVWVGQNDGYV